MGIFVRVLSSRQTYMTFEKEAAQLAEKIKKLEIRAKDEVRKNHVHTKLEYNYYIEAHKCCYNMASLYSENYPDAAKSWRRKGDFYLYSAQIAQNALEEDKKQKSQTNCLEHEILKTDEAELNKPNNQTDSFTSKNSSDDVPLEMIKNWHQSKDSIHHGLSDVVGMDELKKDVEKVIMNNIGWEKLERKHKQPTLKSYMFYGPFGTGKTFFVEGLAKDLMERGFTYLKLDGADLHGKYVGGGEKALRAAFKEAIDCAPSILFFDEFDNVCVEREGQEAEGHERRLTNEFIDAHGLLKNAQKTVIFMAATNYPDRIDGAMLSRILSFFLIPLPSEELRKKYLSDSFEIYTLSDDITYDYMADVTDNYSMRDLDKIKFYIKSELINSAKEQFALKDEKGYPIPSEESFELVDNALTTGKVLISKELFDQALIKCPPEKKDDILASLKAFKNKS